MGILYARVAGAWVPIGTGLSPQPSIVPAYIGPGHDVTTAALYGYYTHGGRIGYASNAPGSLDIISGAGQPINVWSTNVLTDPLTYTQLGAFRANRFTITGNWALGTHPAIGLSALWLDSNESSASYRLAADNAATYLNANTGPISFRIGNNQGAALTSNSFDVNAATLNAQVVAAAGAVNANGGLAALNGTDVYITRRAYQQGGDFGTSWNECQYVVAGAGYYGARVGLNWSNTAAQIRVGQWDPNSIGAVNMNMSAMTPYVASAFNVVSTATTKRRIRTLRPQRERIVVRHNKMSDTVPLPDIMALRPVAYRPKIGELEWDEEAGEAKPAEHPIIKHHGERERLGLIAEDVAAVIPSAVNFTLDGDVRSIDYAQITVALLDHVQQLTELVATLKYRITELENAR